MKHIDSLKGLLDKEEFSESPVRFILQSWYELVNQKRVDIDNFNLIALKEQMIHLASNFFEKYSNDPSVVVEWNDFIANNFNSVYIRSKEGISLLFPFDLIRFSIFDEFIAQLVKEIGFLFKYRSDSPSLAQFIPLVRNVVKNCSYRLSISEYRLLVATMNTEFNGSIKHDLKALKNTTRSTRVRRQIVQKLTALGVYNTGIRINYPVLGLIPYIIYHEKYVELPANLTDYVYMQIENNRNMLSSLLFIPEDYSTKILPKMKRLGKTSKLVKGGSCYNLSCLETDNDKWKIDLKETLVNQENQLPKNLDFTAFEDAPRIEQINDHFIDIISHVSTVEALRAKELATITGKSTSTVSFWFKKITASKACKLQIVLKYIGLPYIYHVLVERDEKDDSSSLVTALHQFPKVSVYEFTKFYLFLVYVPKGTIIDLDDFFDRYSNEKPFKVLSRGLVELGGTLRFENLDLGKLWDKRSKNWSFKE